MKKHTILIISVLFTLNVMAVQNYYVKLDGSDSSNGHSWTNAFKTISKAITSCSNGDTIFVGQGTFTSTTQYEIMNKSITLKGGYNTIDGIQDYSNKTVLDGNGQYRILRVVNCSNTVSIDGFVFKNAKSAGYSGAVVFDGSKGKVSNCEFSKNISLDYGGGGLAFLNITSTNTVVNCSFYGNIGKRGGAIFCGTGTNVDIINSTIGTNYSVEGGNSIYSNGTVNLKNSIVTGNSNVSQEEVINNRFNGLGVQIGGYDNLNQVIGSPTLNDSDWNQMFSRLSYMKPGLVRIAGSEGWNYSMSGQYNPQKSIHILFKILGFCQTNSIDVIWAEWGHKTYPSIDAAWLGRSIRFLDFLINDSSYSCIKYFTMVNEPNGSWSTIQGNTALYKDLIRQTHDSIVAKGLQNKVKLLGPDITITRTAFTGKSTVNNAFLNKAVDSLDLIIDEYDYHLYPGSDQVENDKFYNTILAYKRAIPANKEVSVAELGFAYDPTSTKGLRNIALRESDTIASSTANMMVMESIYGIDIAAATIQLLMAGYKSALYWRLDDAMYMNIDANNKVTLSRWGFWNSLGTEKFNRPSEENLRPWFYPASLLSRYFPKNSTILKVNISDKPGVYAIACKINGKYSIAIVNTNAIDNTIDIRMNGGQILYGLNKYEYVAVAQGSDYTGSIDSNGFPEAASSGISMNLSNNTPHRVTIKAMSFVLYTNIT